jgi:hypothetical protein
LCQVPPRQATAKAEKAAAKAAAKAEKGAAKAAASFKKQALKEAAKAEKQALKIAAGTEKAATKLAAEGGAPEEKAVKKGFCAGKPKDAAVVQPGAEGEATLDGSAAAPAAAPAAGGVARVDGAAEAPTAEQKAEEKPPKKGFCAGKPKDADAVAPVDPAAGAAGPTPGVTADPGGAPPPAYVGAPGTKPVTFSFADRGEGAPVQPVASSVRGTAVPAAVEGTAVAVAAVPIESGTRGCWCAHSPRGARLGLERSEG